MVRIFSFLAAITVSMILIAGWGAYWMSWFEVEDTKQESATVIAKGAALSLSAQIELLNSMLDKMAQDPDVLLAVTRADSDSLSTAAAALEKHLPGVLKIRLLLPGVSELDNLSVPRMGFADLDMVRQTISKQSLPAIQGDNGPDRHLAIARRIIYNDQVIGVILASLSYDFIAAGLQAAATKNNYIELRQGALVLGSAGDKKDVDQAKPLQLKIANTDWDIYYRYAAGSGLGESIIIASIIVIPMLISMLAFFVGYRKLSDSLTEDLRSVMKAFKDLMANKLQGSYPVQLNEMNAVISNLVQFKRVMDSDNENNIKANDDFSRNIIVSDDENFELDSFFDEPKDS
ncbi:MAG: hypothetical protein ACXWTS_03285 [Methylococcaceae bacterium]